jgi:broad specificity phosphatase PhoE
MNVFAIRHGETAWSLSGQHSGTTDIPSTVNGRRLAERLRLVFARESFALVLFSPMQRAHETCEIAGLGAAAVVEPDLVEWNYGAYEGLTPKQIHETASGWLLFRDGCPGEETPEQVGARVDRVIDRTRAAEPMSVYLRTATSCGRSQHAGSGCLPAPDSTSCWIPVHYACSAIIATYPPCGSGTGPSPSSLR